MSFPARYRERLIDGSGGRLVVTIDINRDPCLRVYPMTAWVEIEKQVMSMSSAKESVRKFQRLFVGNASECEMDGNGRILLPQRLRQFACLDKKVVLVGQGERFELWDEEKWNEQQEALMSGDDDFQLPSELESLPSL
ncbi:MAG: division/cell wall cluster transcriptional repressor MraZ [Gammaproteobacteria bacterium]|nr:MAG: division/cell wall cluster transcriptional repressor MraZ [Gammaproteobacteria bacterium]